MMDNNKYWKIAQLYYLRLEKRISEEQLQKTRLEIERSE